MSTDKKSTIGVFSPSYVTIYNSPESAERAENFLSDNGFAIRHGKLWGKKELFVRELRRRGRTNSMSCYMTLRLIF